MSTNNIVDCPYCEYKGWMPLNYNFDEGNLCIVAECNDCHKIFDLKYSCPIVHKREEETNKTLVWIVYYDGTEFEIISVHKTKELAQKQMKKLYEQNCSIGYSICSRNMEDK